MKMGQKILWLTVVILVVVFVIAGCTQVPTPKKTGDDLGDSSSKTPKATAPSSEPPASDLASVESDMSDIETTDSELSDPELDSIESDLSQIDW